MKKESSENLHCESVDVLKSVATKIPLYVFVKDCNDNLGITVGRGTVDGEHIAVVHWIDGTYSGMVRITHHGEFTFVRGDSGELNPANLVAEKLPWSLIVSFERYHRSKTPPELTFFQKFSSWFDFIG